VTTPISPSVTPGPSIDSTLPTLRQNPPSRSAIEPTSSQPLIVSQDGLTKVTLSATGINRLILPATITSAHTNSDAIDADLRGHTAIVTFRTPDQADILFLTAAGQYLLRLIPEDRPSQTIKFKTKADVSATASSYQSQLASLIEAAYRREPPLGYRVDQPGTPQPITGALLSWLATTYKGRTFTVAEYAIYNSGAVSQSLTPERVATHLSLNARAISADPSLLEPGQWGRVFAVFPTDNAPVSLSPVPVPPAAQGGR